MFKFEVYSLCKRIPKGKVSTYGLIAKAMKTKAYRAVGTAMRCNPYAPIVPCHRVIKNDGSIGGFQGRLKGKSVQLKIKMLEKEGIKIKNGKIIDLKKRLYKF